MRARMGTIVLRRHAGWTVSFAFVVREIKSKRG